MLVYDVTDLESFLNLGGWLDNIHMHWVSRDVLHLSN